MVKMSRKLTDALFAVAVLSFVLGFMVLLIDAADTSVGITTDINLDLEDISNNVTTEYETYEKAIHNDVQNISVFEIKENIFIDKTGRGEASLTRQDGEATTTNFLTNVQKKIKIHPSAIGLFVSGIILGFLGLFFRSILGDNRW